MVRDRGVFSGRSLAYAVGFRSLAYASGFDVCLVGRHLAWRALVAALLAAVFCTTGSAEELVDIFDDVTQGEVVAIDSAGAVKMSNGQSVPLDSLRRIRREIEVEPADVNLHLMLPGGGRLRPQSVRVAKEKCDVRWRFGQVTIPLEALRAIHFRPQQTSEEITAAVAAPDKSKDLLFVEVGDQVQTIGGYIEGLDAAGLRFLWKGESRTFARDRVHAVVLTPIGKQPDFRGAVRTRLSDGSLVTGRVASLSGGKLALALRKGVTVTLPWNEVAGVEVLSRRMEFLSDMQPASQLHEPIATLKRNPQRNQSIGGGPLSLGGKKYDKGLGVQSRSVVSYKLGGRFTDLLAVIGIDDETEGRGDCEFVVIGDGRELFRRRMRAADEPHRLRVDVRGVSTLTLTVEPGKGLDLSDHADWADARLIRPGDSS